MKRQIVLVLTSLVILSVLACNVPSLTPAEPPVEPPETTTQESPPDTPADTPSPAPPAPVETVPPPPPPPEIPIAPTGLNVPLRVDNPYDDARTGEPVTSGVPLPRDLNITDPAQLRLVDAEGDPIPAQFTPRARWGGAPDDDVAPIRWLLIDFQATVGPQSTTYYFLQEGGPGPAPDAPLLVTDGPSRITVDTGTSFFTIDKNSGELIAPGLAAPIHGRIRSTDGVTHTTTGPVSVDVVLQGQMRIAIHVRGSYGGLDYTSRYWFYAGQPTARLFYTVENNTPCPLVEYGQLDCQDIGSGGSVAFSDLSLVIPTALGDSLSYQVSGETGPVSRTLSADLVLYQDSSGTEHWDAYPTLTDWDGNPLDTQPRLQSYVTFRGYRTKLGGNTVDSGNQSPGWLSVTGANGSWSIGVRDFWQNFPKALRARPDGRLEIALFPEEFGPDSFAFSLRAGEHKTHEITLTPTPPHFPTPKPFPPHTLFAAAPPRWYVDSGALGLTALINPVDWLDYEGFVLYQLETGPGYKDWFDWFPSLPAAIAATDFYGIFDYGDWPLDYEGYRVAPMNIKYDADYGAWLQWARSGDVRWFRIAEAADRHIADIDILHNLHEPRHWGDGIAFGHSYHDEDGFANPHRNYGGSHPDTAFGMHGLLLTYYLTGYDKAYESALELADCIEYRMRNDYHLCEYFGDCNGEGYGLTDSDGLYAAGTRPAANGLSIAVAAYRATADPRYLAVSHALVDWARAEKQPYINGPTGEDQHMRPWMLNAYLRALAGYMEMQTEFGLPDNSGARDSYLAYADWLRAHAWIDLEAIETGPRAAYPYEWWFDERQGDPNDEWSAGNNIPSINNWLLLGADAMAYAHYLSGDAAYLEHAAALFRTGTRDPWFEDDDNTYNSTKETANSVTFGHTFLHQWAQER